MAVDLRTQIGIPQTQLREAEPRLGGLVAFEPARLLRHRGWPAPCHLFVSASPAPARRREPLLHNASDTELKTRLLALNGTPREILGNDELMELILPVLRADFAILETYEYHEEPPLDVPITVFGATTARRGPRNWRDGAGSQPAHAFICSPAISSSSTE
ncbi:thioesterase II family protein [Streptomyces umbrinus]|uniref:thioesterase II family protein n=1 Tax=Streptomyces umbrinus TaxID=67370 RepID=UPI003C306558